MRYTSTEHLPLEVGVFETMAKAKRAVQNLLEAGFTIEQVTVICSDETKEQHFREFEHQRPAGAHAPKAAIAGGAIGALLGGGAVLATAAVTGSMTLWIAGGLSAWTGAVAGGLIGAMATRGVEKELANFYQQAVIDGKILVAAQEPNVDDEHEAGQPTIEEAAHILAEAGAKPFPLREG